VAGMVPVSRNLVWRPVPLVRNRLRNRLVRRFWMGLGIIGDSIGITIRNFWRRPGTTPGATRFTTGSNYYRGGGERGRLQRRAWQDQPRSRRRAVANRSGRNHQAFQRKHPGGSRIRCTPRSERRPLGRLQRLRPWRTGKELFVTRKRQLRWRRRARGGGGGGGGRWRWRRISWWRWRWRASVIEVSLCFGRL
jgi:hypothetical protein